MNDYLWYTYLIFNQNTQANSAWPSLCGRHLSIVVLVMAAAKEGMTISA